MEHKPDSTGRIQDCTYLSSEKDVGLWKMLVASPTNRNVFVGGLSQGVTSEILRSTFEAFVLKEEEKNHLKVMAIWYFLTPFVKWSKIKTIIGTKF